MGQYLLLTFLVCITLQAVGQDKLYLFNHKVVQGKVIEIGIDSIVLEAPKAKAKTYSMANTKVNYILLENGEKYFVPHDMISLTNGNVISADIQDTSQASIRYYDLKSKSGRIEKVSTQKVLSITFRRGDEVYYYDRVNLRNGKIIAAEVLEVKDHEIVYKAAGKKKAAHTLPVDEISDIWFKNGYRQPFAPLENQ